MEALQTDLCELSLVVSKKLKKREDAKRKYDDIKKSREMKRLAMAEKRAVQRESVVEEIPNEISHR